MLFALLSLLFYQGMASEVWQEREEATDHARSWGMVFALLATDRHPNPEVNSRIRWAKAIYPHDIRSIELWLQAKDRTNETWLKFVVYNHGSHFYTSDELLHRLSQPQNEKQRQFLVKEYGLQYGHLSRPINGNDSVYFSEFLRTGKKPK